MFKGLFSKDIKTANEEIARLSSVVTTKEQSLVEAQGKIVEYEKTIAAFTTTKQESDLQMETAKKEHQSNIDALTVSHKEEVNKLTNQIEETKKSVFKEVSSVVQSIGIPEDTIKISDKNESKNTSSKYKITTVQ